MKSVIFKHRLAKQCSEFYLSLSLLGADILVIYKTQLPHKDSSTPRQLPPCRFPPKKAYPDIPPPDDSSPNISLPYNSLRDKQNFQNFEA